MEKQEISGRGEVEGERESKADRGGAEPSGAERGEKRDKAELKTKESKTKQSESG